MSLDLCLKQLHVVHINVFHRIQYIRLLLFYSVIFQSSKFSYPHLERMVLSAGAYVYRKYPKSHSGPVEFGPQYSKLWHKLNSWYQTFAVWKTQRSTARMSCHLNSVCWALCCVLRMRVNRWVCVGTFIHSFCVFRHRANTTKPLRAPLRDV